MAYVYILKSLTKEKYYIGSTKRNPHVRLREHNLGKVASTKHIAPYKLVRVQEYETYSDARKIENRLKRLKRKDYIQKIVKDGIIRMKI